MKKIKFLGKEYNAESFEFEVDIFGLSDDELDEFEYLMPKREYYFTGGITWNGDDQRYRSVDSYINDERYLEEHEIEIIEAKKLAKIIGE